METVTYPLAQFLEPDVQGQTQDWREIVAHPDPDPDLLPVAIPQELIEQEQTAQHILRACLRLEDAIAVQQARMDADMAAWGQSITRLQAKREAWRASIKDWMQRNNVTQIKCPWFTASIARGRTKIVVVDEGAAIAALKALGADKAIKIRESIVKAELDAIYNARPKSFDGIVTEETSEPNLMVRRAR